MGLLIPVDSGKIKSRPACGGCLPSRSHIMIIQACINGARPAGHHPALPLDVAAMARDAALCVAAGAAELHVHPRGADGRETLDPVVMTMTMRELRRVCPGTLIGVSTGDWIEADDGRTLAAVASWTERPDYASVNLGEPNALAVMEMLRSRGIGIEAGLASLGDVDRLAASTVRAGLFRILIEIDDQDADQAMAKADAVAAALAAEDVRRPILLHGQDATVWPLLTMAVERRWSTRVGLEDGRDLPDGTRTSGNAAMVAAGFGILLARHIRT